MTVDENVSSRDFFAVYNSATGEILRIGQCQSGDMDLQARSGEAVVLRDSPDHHDGNAYVDLSGPDPIIRERPEMGAALDGLTISNIPKGAVLSIDGTDYTVDDGIADLSFNAPGSYRVKLSLFPYLDQSFVVEAP